METAAVLMCSGTFVAAMTTRYELLFPLVLSGTRIAHIMLLDYVRMIMSFTIWCEQLRALQRSARYSTDITQHSAEQTFQHFFCTINYDTGTL